MRIKFYGILLCAHAKLLQVRLKIQICYTHTQRHTKRLPDLCLVHTARCTRLHQLWLHQLYLNLAVRCDYSSPGRTGSTSTLPCAASTRLSAAAALHRLRRTPPRHHLLGVRLPRRLISTSINQKTSRGRLPRHQQLVGSTSN
jgi:hypothetical protein